MILALLVLDSLLIGSIRFVLGKVAAAVDAELNDEGRMREELLAAQMQLELGEIGPDEFAAIERDLLVRLRSIREEQLAQAGEIASGEFRIRGADATVRSGHEGE